MTIVDWIIVAVLAGSVLAGIVQGFFRSVFSLGGVILGLMLARMELRARRGSGAAAGCTTGASRTPSVSC